MQNDVSFNNNGEYHRDAILEEIDVNTWSIKDRTEDKTIDLFLFLPFNHVKIWFDIYYSS